MKLVLVLLAWALCAAWRQAPVAPRPNIVVFLSDDHGWGDLGVGAGSGDIETPHLEALARSGVLARQGYCTAPQCGPSRGGLLVGKFQGRFRLDANGAYLDGFDAETTIATRLREAGYATAHFGKWHLGQRTAIPQHGFEHVFAQVEGAPFPANVTLDGRDRPMGELAPELYHVDACSRAAAALIERYRERPFFLYIAYRAPHTPLDAPSAYTARFPGPMPERRRQALAMLAAVDDGVGLVVGTLERLGLSERTLIFFVSDNGAPLKLHKPDAPLGGDDVGWNGSLNAPLNGEKGMLSEGGIRVPFVVAWPGTIPAGRVFEPPVSTLDIAATAAAQAGIETEPGDLDGVDLVPHFRGERTTPPHEALMWRWEAQAAIREGQWKLLCAGEREYLFDLASDVGEKQNLAAGHPDLARRLRARLAAWCAELDPPGLALGPLTRSARDAFDFHLEGKPIAPPEAPGLAVETNGWRARNGTLTVLDGILQLTPEPGARRGTLLLTHGQLELPGPITARVVMSTSTAGAAALAWRTSQQPDFLPENRVAFALHASEDWQSHELTLGAKGTVVHLRLHLPDGPVRVRRIELESAAGKSQHSWPP